MKKIGLLLICLALLLSLTACGTPAAGGDELHVVATLFPQYDFAKNIALERAAVELLLDFGADAHSYDPTPADIITIAKADLFIYTGGDMELWAEKLLASADIQKAIESGSLRVLDLSQSVELLCLHEHDEDAAHDHDHDHDHDHGEYDPHIWTSPKNAVLMCNAIADALSAIDGEGADAYAQNLAAYTDKLAALDASLADMAASARLSECYFGGSFAFAYLFHDAGLSHVSVFEGCASHAEGSAADIAAVVGAVKASGASYVLYDSPSEQKTAQTIASETGTKLLRLHAIHNITKQEFDAGEDFCSLMQQNIEILRKALG